jgi:hypothetical protein
MAEGAGAAVAVVEAAAVAVVEAAAVAAAAHRRPM